MFRSLYQDDGGDLDIRQKKIEKFVETSDMLLAKHHPGSHLFKNDQRSAMAYLWLHDPDHNYQCKTTEAQYLANSVDFLDTWGTYSNYNLKTYYRFCDELVQELLKNKALMKTHMSRFEGNADKMHPDSALHILAFDLIYCARTYGLYQGITVKSHTSEERKLYQQRREKAAELAVQLENAEKDLFMLNDALEQFSGMIKSGVLVTHKTFGAAKVESYIHPNYAQITLP